MLKLKADFIPKEDRTVLYEFCTFVMDKFIIKEKQDKIRVILRSGRSNNVAGRRGKSGSAQASSMDVHESIHRWHQTV